MGFVYYFGCDVDVGVLASDCVRTFCITCVINSQIHCINNKLLPVGHSYMLVSLFMLHSNVKRLWRNGCFTVDMLLYFIFPTLNHRPTSFTLFYLLVRWLTILNSQCLTDVPQFKINDMYIKAVCPDDSNIYSNALSDEDFERQWLRWMSRCVSRDLQSMPEGSSFYFRWRSESVFNLCVSWLFKEGLRGWMLFNCCGVQCCFCSLDANSAVFNNAF